MDNTLLSRRRALGLGVNLALGGAALTLLTQAQAAETPAVLPPVEADNPTGKALGYVEDASKVDAVKYKQHQAGQICDNCRLVQGKAGDARRPCQLFPGKSVAAKGWCAGWVKLA